MRTQNYVPKHLLNRYPFTPYPKGWYRIARTTDLHVGQERSIQVFGQTLELTRPPSGTPQLRGLSRAYPTVDRNQLIFAYFDPTDNEPGFEVPDITEFRDPSWVRPFNLNWNIRVHIQEVAENALDLSHFCTVHTYMDIPSLTRFDLRGHQFEIDLASRRKILGLVNSTTMNIVYHGLGIVVSNVQSDFVDLKVLLTTTPVNEEIVDLNMEIGFKKTWNPVRNQFFRMILPYEIADEFYRDIPVWESKVYRPKPILCGSENGIIKIRNWAKQFYGDELAG